MSLEKDDQLTERILELIRRAAPLQQALQGVLALEIGRHQLDSRVKVQTRIKSIKSIRTKILNNRAQGRDDYTEASLTDVLGFRLICLFREDIVKTVSILLAMLKEKNVLDCLHSDAELYTTTAPNQRALEHALISKFQEEGFGLQSKNKDSRYTSLHLTCKLAIDRKFNPTEIQIRNVFEDAWSSIEHSIGYKDLEAPSHVKRHLAVLNTLVQGCVEYVEAIREDIAEGLGTASSIKPLFTPSAELERYPTEIRDLMMWIEQMRMQKRHDDIRKRIVAERGDGRWESRRDICYALDMEEALSHLQMNEPDAAQKAYSRILLENENRAFVYLRLCEVHKLKGNYLEALECARKAEEIVTRYPGASSATERLWISERLPLQKSYYLWLTGDFSGAHAVLRKSYDELPQDVKLGRRRDIYNSMVYYDLEVALRGEMDRVRFGEYVEEMRVLQMGSTSTASPLLVDTYAWTCHHIGLNDEASRATLEVLSCVSTENPAAPAVRHEGVLHPISMQELVLLFEHARIILGASRPSQN